MKKFMLILFEDESTYDNFSPEDMQQEIERHYRWVERLGDHHISGEPLEKPAKTIKGKDNIVTDGPYIESKELVSGFYILQAQSFGEAVELSKGCPVLRLGGTVEVREIMEIPSD